MGDSFTEAGQVSFEESFVGLIARHSSCEIRNYGVAGYSPIFYLIQWHHKVKDFRPALVVVQLYSNDISDDASFMHIAHLDSEGLPVAIPGPSDSVMTKVLRQLYLVRLVRMAYLKIQWWLAQTERPTQILEGLVEENPDISALSSRLITALRNEVEGNGAELALFVVPSKYRLLHPFAAGQQALEFSDKWKRWSHENKFSNFVDMVPDFRRCNSHNRSLFFPLDIHFNSKGHGTAAVALCQQLRERLGISAACATAFQHFCPFADD